MSSTNYDSSNKPMSDCTNSVLEQALKQVADDSTFRKVKRMSYSGHAVDSVDVNSHITYFLYLSLLMSLFVNSFPIPMIHPVHSLRYATQRLPPI